MAWLEEKSNGYLILRDRVVNPLNGKIIRVSVSLKNNSRKERKEAQAKLDKKIEKITEKFSLENIRLSKVIEEYLKVQEKTIRESTYRRNDSVLRQMLMILDDVYISKITAGYVREKLINSGKDIITINGYLVRFRAFLQWAYDNDIITDYNIIEKLRKPFPEKKSYKERIKDKYLEKEELVKLIDGLDQENWKLITEFLALSGMRVGEMLALENADIGEEYIHVTKTLDAVTGKTGVTKTAAGTRDVFIQPELKKCIRDIRLYMKKSAMAYGFRTDHFIADTKGDWVKYASYANYLKENSEKIIGRRVTPHMLRHTHTSLLAEAGVPIGVISRRLGHENSGVTQSIYMHVTEGLKKKDNIKMEQVTLIS